MTLIIDASCLFSQASWREPQHAAVTLTVRAARETIVTTELVAAEADYMILSRIGVDAELAYLQDLAAGTYAVECLSRDDIRTAREIVARYRDLRLGLADASLVVLAARHRTRRILTLDERAFRVVTPLQGGSFTVLPADEPPSHRVNEAAVPAG